MKDLLNKHWISFLGVTFLFLSFLYFLKIAFDMNWVPPSGRAAIGLSLGITGLFAGYSLYRKNRIMMAEIISGLGASIMFATFAYASFSEHIQWSTNTLLVSLISLGGLVTVVGYKMNMRILVAVSLLGGLFTPLIIRANPDQDLILFLYVFVLNVTALYLSVVKGWGELKLVAFITTVIIYASYYVFFEPESWSKPFFYASSLFFVYMVGLTMASISEKDKFEGMNLYLGLINAIHYVFWCIFIFESFAIPYALPTLIVGGVFVVAAATLHRLSPDSILASGAYLFLGMMVMAIAGSDLGKLFETPGMHHVINASIWFMIAGVVYAIGHLRSNLPFKYTAMVMWTLVVVFWYGVAWDVEWVRWFGVKYIPFINPGALVWMAAAAFGFMMARIARYEKQESTSNSMLSTFLAVASHLVVGGLLTVQLDNTWMAYDITFSLHLMISIAWTLYALTLFLWGSWNQDRVFRTLGSVVLIITSLKVFFFDLYGEATFQKVVALMLIGGLMLSISYIHRRWQDNEVVSLREPNEDVR